MNEVNDYVILIVLVNNNYESEPLFPNMINIVAVQIINNRMFINLKEYYLPILNTTVNITNIVIIINNKIYILVIKKLLFFRLIFLKF